MYIQHTYGTTVGILLSALAALSGRALICAAVQDIHHVTVQRAPAHNLRPKTLYVHAYEAMICYVISYLVGNYSTYL